MEERGVAAGEAEAEADWFLEDLKKVMVVERVNAWDGCLSACVHW